MKKLLSILLTVCMLISMVFVPVALQAESTQEISAYEKSTLGSYYKFTFGESGDRFQYTVGNNQTSNTTGQYTYKNNAFYPLWTNSMYTGADLTARMSWGYETVEDAQGKTYDVLEIKNSTTGLFTPLTTNGKPFEMKPGAKYKVDIEYFNPIAVAQSSLQMGPATTNNKAKQQYSGQYWNDNGTLATSSYMYAYLPFRSGGKGPVNGENFNVYVPGAVSTNGTIKLPCIKNDSCTTKYLKLYRKDSAVISIPEENAVFNEANQSYTVNVPNGNATITANNYLTLCLNAGKGSFNSESHPIHSSEGTTLPVGTELNTWQIVSIEIYEIGVGSAKLYVGDDVITLKGDVGENIDVSSVVAPEGYIISGWYADVECNTPIDVSALTFNEGAPIDIYAKLEEIDYDSTTLGSYYKFTFGENGDRFQYTVGNNQTSDTTGQHTYKNNTFYPLWTNSNNTGDDLAEKMSWGYKTVEDAQGNTYDVLEIKNSTTGLFTPLTANGTPFEMKPGAKYKVNVEYFNPVAVAQSSLQMGPATTNNKETQQYSGQYWNDNGVLATSSYMNAYLPFRSGGKGPVSGQNFNVYVPGAVSTNGTMKLPCIKDSCENKYLKLYRKDSAVISIPEENAVFNEVNQSYTVNVPNGDATIIANNYFTLCFNSGKGSFDSNGHPIFAPEGTEAPQGTELNTWQIVSIEIWQQNIVSYSENGAASIKSGAVDGHTYKVEFFYTAKKPLTVDAKYNFGTAKPTNAFDTTSYVNTEFFTISKDIEVGEKYRATRYITVDLAGDATGSVTGHDYNVKNDCNELFMYFGDGESGSIYFEDIVVTDLNSVIGTGSASKLNADGLAQTNGKQAIRYYFNYETTDGSVLKMDGRDFTVAARGFIFKNGELSDGMYTAGLTLGNVDGENIKKCEKTANFDSCWWYDGTKMTYSIHFTGFELDDEREVVVRGYITLIDPETNENFTIYSDTINRSVVGVTEERFDCRQLVWSEEFGSEASLPSSNDSAKFSQIHRISSHETEGTIAHNISLNDGDSKGNLAIVNDNSDEKTDGSALNIRSYKDENGTTQVAKTIHTFEKMTFRYGYLEMRAKVPSVKGAWASFWLRSGNAYTGATPFGEIDIFEVYGTHYNKANSTDGVVATAFHKWLGRNFNNISSDNGHCNGDNSPDDFVLFGNNRKNFDPNVYHTFAIDWTPEAMTFYVDNQVYYKVDMTVDMCGHDANGDGTPDHNDGMACFNDDEQKYFVLIGNKVFNSTDHNWAPQQCVSNIDNFEANYYVDYVRLYQNPSIGETITFYDGCVHPQ